MFLHYFSKKENHENKIANQVYKSIILYVQDIVNNKDLFLKKEFNSSFELVSLFLFVIFFGYRLKPNCKQINQLLINIYINDIDKSFREQGVGDMSIGKYVKSYVKKMYYRFNKLEKIFLEDDYNAFIEYIKKINIQNRNHKISELTYYLFQLINKLLKNAKKDDLSDFKFIINTN